MLHVYAVLVLELLGKELNVGIAFSIHIFIEHKVMQPSVVAQTSVLHYSSILREHYTGARLVIKWFSCLSLYRTVA